MWEDIIKPLLMEYKTTSNGINVLNIELNNSLLWTVIVQ